MNWDEISGSWTQIRGKAREQWGELTDSELDQIGGRRDQLVGLLQQKYGHLRAAAERELDAWAGRLEPAPSTAAAAGPAVPAERHDA